jgi:hypothetical protein
MKCETCGREISRPGSSIEWMGNTVYFRISV